ncbi:hypothetical protein MmTuc01_0321 [Methanosarcina mazei Tuc01]|uniref:Uncharacterized protein n=1 Tax=Methanosarcina mazei Tuc01 TaxID=1236903 RepID=M1Q0G2_METMZ|nr:hypothetical protein MmTuc01_0321 [Methanosarcina mazei Tuc01]
MLFSVCQEYKPVINLFFVDRVFCLNIGFQEVCKNLSGVLHARVGLLTWNGKNECSKKNVTIKMNVVIKTNIPELLDI